MRFRTLATVVLVGALVAACSQSSSTQTDSSQTDSSTSTSITSTSIGSDGEAPTTKDCAGTEIVAHRDLRYASDPGVAAELQSLDLYLPALPAKCAAMPVVVYVHGGAFRVGDKANSLTDKINLFTGAGWAFASLNYRLVGDPGAGPTNGMYPAAEQDVAAGIGYLAERASELDLDAKRFILLGHSAGAFLVALVSTDGSFLQAAGVPLANVACTVPLDSTYDIPIQVAAGGVNAAMYRNAFGGDPTVWAKGSPRRNVTAGKEIPDFHVVTRGTARRVAEAQQFGTVLRTAGVTTDVQVATGLTHEEVNAAVGRPGDTIVTPPLMSFYRSCVEQG